MCRRTSVARLQNRLRSTASRTPCQRCRLPKYCFQPVHLSLHLSEATWALHQRCVSMLLAYLLHPVSLALSRRLSATISVECNHLCCVSRSLFMLDRRVTAAC